MVIRSLKLSRFRCLADAELDFDPRYNLIHGPNASGKTSLLEALAYLGRGKSFRGAPVQAVVQHGERDFVVFGRVLQQGREVSVGVRNGREALEVRIDGEAGKGIADLAGVLPLQVIDPEVHSLVAGGPEQRRRFIDWIVFHVEPGYLAVWRRFRRVLKQRNSLLKQGAADRDLDTWDEEFATVAGEVHRLREQGLELALPAMELSAATLLEDHVALAYQQGWKAGSELRDALAASRDRDRQMGSSQVGPHRGELRIAASERQAKRLVSRGQQKLLASALILGASDVVQRTMQRPILLLMDDPAAELDRDSLRRMLAGAVRLEAQLVVTSLEPGLIEFPSEPRRFHVEHGAVKSLS